MINRTDYNTSLPSSFHSPSSFRGAPTNFSEGATPRNKKEAGGRKGDHTIHGSDGIGSVPGRARRARTAFTIAGALVLVDGPLPFGDMAAATFLVAYGSYEIGKSIQIMTNELLR